MIPPVLGPILMVWTGAAILAGLVLARIFARVR